jgi:hypothetical protein
MFHNWWIAHVWELEVAGCAFAMIIVFLLIWEFGSWLFERRKRDR